MIAIKRSGAVYQGAHEPLIDPHTFAVVQEVRAGKAGKKVTRHNHLYRGLVRCGLCRAALSPERQKGRVYYRCQTRECPTKTVREDRLEKAIVEKLRVLELTEKQVQELRDGWLTWVESDTRDTELRSLEMRIGQVHARLEGLTDLLIDGTLNKPDFDRRKRTLTLELAGLEDDRGKAARRHLSVEQMEKFLELMKSLSALYISADSHEKRILVRNIFSNCVAIKRSLELEPRNWLREVKTSACVSNGDPYRHTSRTLKRLETLTKPIDDDLEP